jgi:hypothetical protein
MDQPYFNRHNIVNALFTSPSSSHLEHVTMPELLEEPIAEVKEESAHIADTGEPSGSTLADETPAEPVIECHESTAESSDTPEAPALSDSISGTAMVDESVAELDESVAVLEEPVADLDEPIAVLEEPVAVHEESSAAVPEVTSASDDEPAGEHAVFESTSEAPELADEPIEAPAIEEAAAVLAAPIAEAADQCSVDSAAAADVVADQVTEIHDAAAQVDEADALA